MARSRLAQRMAAAPVLMAVILAGCSTAPEASSPDTPIPTPNGTAGSVLQQSAQPESADPAVSLDDRAGGATLVTADLGIAPQGEVLERVRVERVVDGDTFKAVVDGELVSVRIIGFDTPETVKPGSPIECFGPESSAFADAVLSGADVTLEFDQTQGRYDRYGRVLAHVWVPTDEDGVVVLFGAEAVAQGYAEERQYGDEPTAWTGVMRDLESRARDSGAGMWGAC